jgi:DinB superfamily
VEQKLARHYERVRHLRESFAEANERLVARLRRVEHGAAERAPDGGGWSAAQIGWHVAAVTTQFAGLMSGDTRGAQPLPADFVERPWTGIAAEIPPRFRTSSPFEPPVRVTRDEAVALLEAAAVRFARALDRLTPERGGGSGITSPIVGGTISVYQIGEWATAHVIRHNRQAKRTLGEG